jgi:hypothetical protein
VINNLDARFKYCIRHHAIGTLSIKGEGFLTADCAEAPGNADQKNQRRIFQTKDGLAPKFIFKTFAAITRVSSSDLRKKLFSLKGLGHEMDWKSTPK